MNLQSFFQIFTSDPEQASLLGASHWVNLVAEEEGENNELDIQQLALNLFTSKGKDEAIPRVLEILRTSHIHVDACRKMKSEIGRLAENNGDALGLSQEQISRIKKVCSLEMQEESEEEYFDALQIADASSSLQTVQLQPPPPPSPPPPVEPLQWDKFPNECCSFENLEDKASALRTFHSEAKRIIDEINWRTQHDPEIVQLTHKDGQFPDGIDRTYLPYDSYRAGRDIPGVYFNGSDVHTDLQHFLLYACPHNERDTADFFDTILDQGISVIVSLHQKNEPGGKWYDFWEEKRLTALSLSNGWSLQKISAVVLGEVHMEPGGTCIPRIVESTLLATDREGDKQVELKHFHYDGWKDGCPAPSEYLLEVLYSRIESLPSYCPQIPVAVGCRAGLNRTGLFALGLYNRRYIDRCLNERREKTINIPENLYREFRRRRAGVMQEPGQLSQVYVLASTYYKTASLRPPPTPKVCCSLL